MLMRLKPEGAAAATGMNPKGWELRNVATASKSEGDVFRANSGVTRAQNCQKSFRRVAFNQWGCLIELSLCPSFISDNLSLTKWQKIQTASGVLGHSKNVCRSDKVFIWLGLSNRCIQLQGAEHLSRDFIEKTMREEQPQGFELRGSWGKGLASTFWYSSWRLKWCLNLNWPFEHILLRCIIREPRARVHFTTPTLQVRVHSTTNRIYGVQPKCAMCVKINSRCVK